jgi:hypothetical protein
METMTPPLAVLLNIRWEMENGSSFRESLRLWFTEESPIGEIADFNQILREWMVRKTHDQDVTQLLASIESPYRRALFQIFARGWDGEPILEPLSELESELHQAADEELDGFIATLPFRAMMPLLLLQFPAYLLLLIGPMLLELTSAFGPGK